MIRRNPMRSRHRRGTQLAVVALPLLLMALAACTTSPSPSPSSGTASQVPTGNGTPNPNATPWPSSVVASTIALAGADSQFSQIGTDLSSAVNSGDLTLLLAVTDNISAFLTAQQTNIPALQRYDFTKSLGDGLAAAYAQMIAGNKQIHDSLVAGNGAGVTAGFNTFVAGNTAYSALRADLGDKATQAIFMKRIFNL